MSEERRYLIKKVIKSFSVVLYEELLDEIEDHIKRKNRIWTRQWILKRSRGAGASNNILKELSMFDPKQYKSIMRMLPEQFMHLLNMVAPHIQKQNTLMRDPLPAHLKLEVVLAYLATGTPFNILEAFFRLPKSSISKMIPEVCDAISKCLKEYLKVPNLEEWERIQIGFGERWNFPSCCGAIDGKHVFITAPPNSGSEYHNYKGRNSIILLAVVDHDYCFRYIDVGSYGRNADAGVFQRSSLFARLENNSLLPNGGFLVGDDAFPLKTYLLKPFSRNSMNRGERIFNYRLSRARRIVENGFGILATRFRVLLNTCPLKVETTEKIVVAACSLHNWLRMTSPNSYTPPGSVDYEDILNATVVQGNWRAEIGALQSVQRARATRTKRIAEALRNRYKEYFLREGAVAWQDKVL